MTKLSKSKLLLTSVAIFLLVNIIFAPVVLAQQNPDNRRDALQEKLAELKKQIDATQAQIASTKKQQASLKNEISIYDNQMRSLELQIQANKTQSEDTSLQIAELKTQIAKREVEIKQNQDILAQLIRQLAQSNNQSWLKLALSSSDFSDFLNQVQYTENVQAQMSTLVKKISEVKARLETQQADLEVKLRNLQDLVEQLNQSENALAGQRSQKQGLLDQTRGLERNYQKLLTQSKGEEADILKEIYDLDEAARSRSGGGKIIPSKGVFAWPMEGTMTQGYGNTGFTALGYNFHNGIDLAAPAGKPIYAVADGSVNGVGKNDDVAYGNWVTIRHTVATKNGNADVVTLYAHMRSIKVSNGQPVKQGDLIGYEGNTGNTTRLLYGPERGYHLHFTVFAADGFQIVPGKFSKTYGAYAVPSGVTYNPLDFLGGRR